MHSILNLVLNVFTLVLFSADTHPWISTLFWSYIDWYIKKYCCVSFDCEPFFPVGIVSNSMIMFYKSLHKYLTWNSFLVPLKSSTNTTWRKLFEVCLRQSKGKTPIAYILEAIGSPYVVSSKYFSSFSPWRNNRVSKEYLYKQKLTNMDIIFNIYLSVDFIKGVGGTCL